MMVDMSVEERILKVREACIEQFARLPIYLAERLADAITTAITEAVEAERAACYQIAMGVATMKEPHRDEHKGWIAGAKAVAKAIEARTEKQEGNENV